MRSTCSHRRAIARSSPSRFSARLTCVGNGFVLETINDALRVFTTAAKPVTAPVDLNSFYGYPPVINRTTGVFGPELADPSCFFDSLDQRWIHIALTLDTRPKSGALTLNNHVDIAVSKSADPTAGSDTFAQYQKDPTCGQTRVPAPTGRPESSKSTPRVPTSRGAENEHSVNLHPHIEEQLG